MSKDSHDSYKAHQHQKESFREIEARVLINSANCLEQARQPNVRMAFYTSVLQRNQRLWVVFQVALADPENPLPADLKKLLLNLCVYINKLSFRAITKHQPELLEGLININRRVAAGLRAKPKTDEQQPDAGGASAPPLAGATSASISTSV